MRTLDIDVLSCYDQREDSRLLNFWRGIRITLEPPEIFLAVRPHNTLSSEGLVNLASAR